MIYFNTMDIDVAGLQGLVYGMPTQAHLNVSLTSTIPDSEFDHLLQFVTYIT